MSLTTSRWAQAATDPTIAPQCTLNPAPTTLSNSKWAHAAPTPAHAPAAPITTAATPPPTNPAITSTKIAGSKYAPVGFINDDEPAAPDMPRYKAPRCNPHFTPDCMNGSKWATVEREVTEALVPAIDKESEEDTAGGKDWASMIDEEESAEGVQTAGCTESTGEDGEERVRVHLPV